MCKDALHASVLWHDRLIANRFFGAANGPNLLFVMP
jgi:hypothetical protein